MLQLSALKYSLVLHLHLCRLSISCARSLTTSLSELPVWTSEVFKIGLGQDAFPIPIFLFSFPLPSVNIFEFFSLHCFFQIIVIVGYAYGGDMYSWWNETFKNINTASPISQLHHKAFTPPPPPPPRAPAHIKKGKGKQFFEGEHQRFRCYFTKWAIETPCASVYVETTKA